MIVDQPVINHQINSECIGKAHPIKFNIDRPLPIYLVALSLKTARTKITMDPNRTLDCI